MPRALCRHTDENRPPFGTGHIVRGLDDIRHPCVIDRDINSLVADDPTDFLRHPTVICVQRVRRAEPRRQLQLVVVQIDRDDRVRGNHRGELHDVQSHTPSTEHGDGFPDVQVRVVVDHPHRSRHGAAHQRPNFRIEVARYFGDPVL